MEKETIYKRIVNINSEHFFLNKEIISNSKKIIPFNEKASKLEQRSSSIQGICYKTITYSVICLFVSFVLKFGLNSAPIMSNNIVQELLQILPDLNTLSTILSIGGITALSGSVLSIAGTEIAKKIHNSKGQDLIEIQSYLNELNKKKFLLYKEQDDLYKMLSNKDSNLIKQILQNENMQLNKLSTDEFRQNRSNIEQTLLSKILTSKTNLKNETTAYKTKIKDEDIYQSGKEL